MASVELKIDLSHLHVKLNQARQIQQQAMPQIYQEFVRNTPIAKKNGGNARANTHLQGRRILADYPYASVLNDGRGFRDGQMRGSDQAPDGMVTPTLQFAQTLLKKLAQGLSNG